MYRFRAIPLALWQVVGLFAVTLPLHSLRCSERLCRRYYPYRNKHLFLFLALLVFSLSSLSAGVVSRPRKMSVISTKYFDIIFAAESSETANILFENADKLYQKAKDAIGAKNEIRIVVVISPDSDKFSVTYSPNPYNRIVIYDAVPDTSFFKYDQILLDAFYHEVLKGVGQSIRNPFIDKVAKILAVDAFQPVNIFNMPFSFIEGIASLEDENENVLNDNYNLQILMQAKLDGKFPSWINAAGSRDIKPGDELSKIAGIAFAAYLQQRFGLQKYIEFWEKSGNIYFVVFTQTIFYSVYGERLSSAWNDFMESIPLPENSENENQLESNTETIFEKEFYKLYSNLVSTPYGLVWYDDLNHEVSLYNPNAISKSRRLLFLADNVTKLSVDKTGRFLSISFLKNKMRGNLNEYQTKIYDLREHSFFSETFDLNDACIVTTKDRLYAVAGVNMQKKNPQISVVLSEDLNDEFYDETKDEKFDDIKREEIFSLDFEKNDFPYSLSRGSDGSIVCLLNRMNETFFYSIEFEEAQVLSEYFVPLDELGTGITNLQPLKNYTQENGASEIYTFQFFPSDIFSFAKAGCIAFSADGGLQSVVIQKENISGGVYFPVLFDSDVYFYSKKTDCFVFRKINANNFRFEKVELPVYEDEESSYVQAQLETTEIAVSSVEYKKYNPLKYMFHGIWIPMLPLRDFSVETKLEPELWPGLGVAYSTQSDPLENNDLMLSASAGFTQRNFTSLINPTDETIKKSDFTDFSKDFTVAGYFKNTTTPIDISVGGIANFTKAGQYNLKSFIETNWTIPLGMTFRKLDLNILSLAQWSTKYKNSFSSEELPDLAGWTNVKDSYKSYDLFGSAKYSNLHQAGISPYEVRGLEASFKLYSLWDFTEIDARPQVSPDDSTSQDTAQNDTTNTDDASVNTESSSTDNSVWTDPSLFSFSLYVKFYTSRLNPLPDYNGWILSLPSSLSFAVLKDEGTAFSASTKVMLIGKEIQYGIPFLDLYLTRFGLSLGYDLDFDYSVKKDLLPDIRLYKQFTDVFANTVLNDKISIDFDFVFSPVIGMFSRIGMNGNFKFVYSIQTNEFRFSFDMKFKK